MPYLYRQVTRRGRLGATTAAPATVSFGGLLVPGGFAASLLPPSIVNLLNTSITNPQGVPAAMQAVAKTPNIVTQAAQAAQSSPLTQTAVALTPVVPATPPSAASSSPPVAPAAVGTTVPQGSYLPATSASVATPLPLIVWVGVGVIGFVVIKKLTQH